MPKKLQAIDFGVKFVEGAFACRPESPLDKTAKEHLKLQLTTYANVFGIKNFDTDLQTIISCTPSYDIFLRKLAYILLSIERRIYAAHDPQQRLDAYFFISSSITLVEVSFESLRYARQGFDRSTLEVIYPFLERAIKLSNEIGIKPPNITKYAFMNDDIQDIQKSLKSWMAIMRKRASRSTNKWRLVFRGLLKGIPYIGPAIDALIFGKD